jgi:hypothetical protein
VTSSSNSVIEYASVATKTPRADARSTVRRSGTSATHASGQAAGTRSASA